MATLLKNAVFTDSQAKVYLWIYGQPERSYHLSELRRLTGLGSASLQREINRLVVTGLANSTLKGNQRQISANRQSPLFKELSDLTCKVMGAAALLAWPASQWRLLDVAQQKRNLAEYEGFLEIEESAIVELRLLAEKLFADVDRLIGAGKDTNISTV